MADEVRIIDDNGIAHVFPAGFDPIRAAKIVKQNAEKPGLLSRFVDWAVEPSRLGTAISTRDNQAANLIDTTERTPVHARITDMLADAPGIASDIASGLVHHPIATLRGGAAGAMQGVGDVIAANSSPMAVAALAAPGATKAADAIGVPALSRLVRVGNAATNAGFMGKGAHDVVTAPDIEGKLIAGAQALSGAAGVGSDPVMGRAVRAGARGVGESMIEAAKHPGFIRGGLVGAMGGGLATGHISAVPLGAASMIAIPPALRAGGNALVRFGTGGAAVVPNAAGSIGAAAPRGLPEPARVPYDPIMEQVDHNSTPKSETPGALSEVEKNALRKAGQTDAGIALVEAASIKKAGGTPPVASPSAAPAEPNLGAGDINLTGPNVVPDEAVPAGRDYRGLSEQNLRNASSNDNWHTGRSGQMGSLPTETGLQVPDEESWFANKPPEIGTQAADLESRTNIPADLKIEGEGNPESVGAGVGGNYPPGPAIGGDLGKFGDGLLDAAAGTPPGPTARPKLDVPMPKSKSRRSPPSATPGLTVEDMTGLGLNPKIRMTKVTQEVADAVRKNRAARALAYRTDAGLNRGFADALAQDQP